MTGKDAQETSLWEAAASGLSREDTRSPEHRLLPHDLDVALKHLTDGELARLLEAVTFETRRRGLMGAGPLEKRKDPQPSRKQEPNALSELTQSQINLIRSSIKAGVKPNVLARQFGLSKAQIRAALSGQ